MELVHKVSCHYRAGKRRIQRQLPLTCLSGCSFYTLKRGLRMFEGEDSTSRLRRLNGKRAKERQRVGRKQSEQRTDRPTNGRTESTTKTRKKELFFYLAKGPRKIGTGWLEHEKNEFQVFCRSFSSSEVAWFKTTNLNKKEWSRNQ